MAEDTPVDPSQDYEAGLADGTSSPSDVPVADIDTSPAPVDTTVDPEASLGANETIVPAADVQNAPEDLPADTPGLGFTANASGLISKPQTSAASDPLAALTGAANGGTFTGALFSTNPADAAAAQIAAGTKLAQQQAAIAAQRGQQQQADWRVRLQLATGANYLYRASNPGILQPLVPTDGIIFPYTPKIDLSYKANYSSYELTHSNYKGYFYQNSSVEPIQLTAHFTAQSTADANYVLAVIHFFRTATKMFYGQDAQRGSPPPLVFLSGLGQYQFNNHPCLISEFTYSLPEDVDYIRAQTTNNAGLNLTSVNNVKQGVATNTIFAQIQRLAAAFTTPGALPNTPFGSTSVPNLAQGSPTYVPTKIDITIRLLPVNTRSQVSQQFSVKEFAKGNLLRDGFW